MRTSECDDSRAHGVVGLEYFYGGCYKLIKKKAPYVRLIIDDFGTKSNLTYAQVVVNKTGTFSST